MVKMNVLFLNAEYTGKVELCKETVDYIKDKKYNKIGLYASVQFVNKLDKIKEQLSEFTIITSKADRTNEMSQLLGCDNYHNSLNLSKQKLDEIDCYLYIGDGKFHPLALVYRQKDLKSKKEVICSDPIQNKMFILSEKDVSGLLIKYKSSLMKFLSSDKVGVIITIKPGQEQFKPSLELEKKYPDKKFFYFIDNNVSFDHLENFPFIQTWVNTTCPRVGLDDQEKFLKGVINLNDALRVDEILK
jgi:diphthamide biosynthesis enzyme Dph1/Dph2-like protein